ncbi:MAG TPA: hypothetical protein VM221_02265 [Armatimonadota bacterium]|nr:hypothetical protein [Armatimonadota bacterium]
MKKPRENGDEPKADPRGPAVWENWIAALKGREFPGAYEVPLYTDAYVTGELEEGYGPYRLLNLVPHIKPGVSRQAIVLRVEAQIVFDSEDPLFRLDDLPRGTKCKRYHGGGRDDEVAALFSLSLGIRLKPGDWSRWFIPGEDPKGRPRPRHGEEPVLLRGADRRVIPGPAREQSLNDDVLVKHLPLVEPSDAFAIVRAARLYQDALWIAESQPELSWLMFVSAVETAANHWRSAEETPRERLHASKPELEEQLVAVGGEAHADKVAHMMVESLGSTKKFVDFVSRFWPDPPSSRPPEWAQFPWDDKTAIKKATRTIYDYRSTALHDGTPFPLPMCEPPWIGGMPVPSERPGVQATYLPAAGVQWTKGDLPMHLHTFEYIVQGALCKWWNSMIPADDTAGGPSTGSGQAGCAT